MGLRKMLHVVDVLPARGTKSRVDVNWEARFAQCVMRWPHATNLIKKRYLDSATFVIVNVLQF